MKNKFLKNEVSTIIFNEIEFKDYVASIISKATNLDFDFVNNNLVLDNNRINENTNIKFSEVDAIYRNDSMYFNIEINAYKSNTSINKNFRYICHLLLKQVPIGEKDKYKKVYQININDYDYFNKGEFIYESSIMENKYHIKRNELFTIIDINLEHLRKLSYNEIERENRGSLKKLLYIFICNDSEKRKELYTGDEIMEKINNRLEYLTDEMGNLYYDKEEFKKAEQYELGTKDGIEIGKNIGEKNKAIEIAKNLLKMDLTIEDIIKATSLTREEIENL